MGQPERIRIAQELHDGIAQDLVALSYSLDLLLAAPDTPADIRIEVRKILFKVSEIIASVRTEIFNLRTQALDTLEESLQILLLEMNSVIEISISQEECDLSDPVQEELLAISREFLRNTIKHSGASVTEISIEKSDDGAHYTYRDNGKGMDPSAILGFGIRGVQERCSSIHADLIMSSTAQGVNFQIKISR
ncbi:MAG: hypothetical protein F2708_02900 [Actinobacteria bacterium]|uniref:histidine kinase n=1 Tax=freshwater metagenome TaxID=449393 RepID=A0A6J6U754_9ZZZZ|nr:hypothetical protein [Actinomycetota bacterium]MSY93762.1 hypothetical protein [Actinomycetota bacterium]